MLKQVQEYYNENAELEWERLSNPYSRVELETTKYLLKKYMPSNGHVLDIGSGPGRYSIEMLKSGYKVSLLDISSKELDIAKEKIESMGLKAEGYHCQSAVELDNFEDESFDAVLVMGPLYHLHDRSDRMNVLTQANRIVKKNGIVFISYINTWGLLRAAVSEFPDSFEPIEHFESYINGSLNLTENTSFTAVHFTNPDLALAEVKESGFEIVSYAGAESFLSGLNTQIIKLNEYNKTVYNNFVQKACEYCELPQYRDATEHLHIIARKNPFNSVYVHAPF